MKKPQIKDRFAHIKALAGPVFVLVMFIAALWFLHLELKEYSLQEFREGLLRIPAWNLALAIVLTLLNYAILICYDWLGIWYIRHPMKFGRVALASFLGYSVGNNFGLLFGGSTIRYRLYSTWGLSAADIVKLLFILAITFWIGLFALSGVVFLIEPLEMPEVVKLPMKTTRPLGAILTGLAVAYLIACAIGRPLKLAGKQFSPPPFGLSVMQYFVAGIDLLVAAGIVYVLLPEAIEISYFRFVAIFLLAQVAVFVTQVPGGLGVLELSLLTLLAPPPAVEPELFGALMAYRLIFYLTPMVIGISLLGVNELVTQRKYLKLAIGSMGQWTPDTAPRFVALFVFLCGISLLFAAALPVEEARMQMLTSVFSLWFIELCYFLAALFGVLFLLLSRGLYRRIRAAYDWAVPTFLLAISVTLVGSLGYLEAIFLSVGFLVVVPISHLFHRRGKLLSERIAYHWLIAIAVVILVSAWLYWFSYKSREDLGFNFWQFAADADAPRSLRAVLGAAMIAFGFYLVRVLQLSIGRPETTTHRELQAAQQIVAASNDPDANLMLLGDKRLLFNEQQTACLSYGIYRKSCVALGNPTGDTDDVIQLAWDFREFCQQQELWPVFYLVDDRFISLYQEMNLKLVHIADEAIVDLARFDLQSPALAPVAQSHQELADLGFHIEFVPGDHVEAILPDLDRINNSWQHDRGGPEHRFSISYFNPEFLKRNPVAVVRESDRMVGFASLWQGSDRDTITIDLVRYLPESPPAILDYLITEVLLAGQRQRFRFFSLGSAPLNPDQALLSPELRWQLMSLAFRLSRHFYSYQGLRNYKERFQPSWQPLFVALPPDRPRHAIIADIATLIGSKDPAAPSKA